MLVQDLREIAIFVAFITTNMKQHLKRWIAALLISPLFISCHRTGETDLSLQVNTLDPGFTISNQMIGLSYETSTLLPRKGVYYFNPQNTELLNVFRTLGIKHLRLGGNSVDEASIPQPAEADIRSFFEFAKAANLKVIYSFRLKEGDPLYAKNTARFILDNYAEQLESFAIGNEPSYYKDYALYVSKWTAIRNAILESCPQAVFSGPDQNPDAERLKLLADDFAEGKGRLVQLSQHNYPFGCSYVNYKEHDVSKLIPRDTLLRRNDLLSDSAYTIYREVRDGMLEAVKGKKLSFRLTETNNLWYSGLEGVSDRYVSALWGLDYLHWWSAQGIAGLNFHTGDSTGGAIALPCRYAVFVRSDQGLEARPLAYGIKMFEQGAAGRILPLKINSGSASQLSTYAYLNEDNELLITLINKNNLPSASFETTNQLSDSTNKKNRLPINNREERPPVHNRTVSISFDREFSGAALLEMKAKDNYLGALATDISLGESGIETDGKWKGQWKKLKKPAVRKQIITLELEPASAVVLKISLN